MMIAIIKDTFLKSYTAKLQKSAVSKKLYRKLYRTLKTNIQTKNLNPRTKICRSSTRFSVGRFK